MNSPAFPQQLSHRTHRRNSRNSRCLPGQEASKDSHRRHAAWSQVQKSTWTWGHLPKAHHFPCWPGPGIPAQWSEEMLHTLTPRLLFQRLPRNLCPSIKEHPLRCAGRSPCQSGEEPMARRPACSTDPKHFPARLHFSTAELYRFPFSFSFFFPFPQPELDFLK